LTCTSSVSLPVGVVVPPILLGLFPIYAFKTYLFKSGHTLCKTYDDDAVLVLRMAGSYHAALAKLVIRTFSIVPSLGLSPHICCATYIVSFLPIPKTHFSPYFIVMALPICNADVQSATLR
jgi:hypothetical protein